MASAALSASATLPQCSDDGPRVWPTPMPVSDQDCASRQLKNSPLCLKTVGILNATCDALSSKAEHYLDVPVLAEHRLQNIRTDGVFQSPSELAALLLHLARETRSHSAPLRFLATNANNGWTAVLAAAFLHRTHKGGFIGLAYNDLKWEWACNEPTRDLTRRSGLSWRHTRALFPAAEAALMSYHPKPRSPLWQTAFSNATELMPVSWVGTPPPFDVCWRMGQLGPSASNRSGYEGLAVDLALLVGWCRLFVYYGPQEALQSDAVQSALSASSSSSHRLLHGARQVGGFTIVHAAHANHDDEVPFGYTNKTPPAAPEYFSAGCIEDAGGCQSHHHQERCGYPRGRDSLPLACLPTSPMGLCCEKPGAPDWTLREERLNATARFGAHRR